MPMAVLIRVNLLFYIIFYFTCPIMRYISFALCALNKDQFYSSLFLRKAPIQDTIFPLFEELNQTTWNAHCPPPPTLKKVVFLRSCDVPAAKSQIMRCEDTNLFEQAPQYYELYETPFPNVIFALSSSIFSPHETIYQALYFYSNINLK